MIQDNSIANWLREDTKKDGVVWQIGEHGRFFTIIGDIRIEIWNAPQRAGSRIYLTFIMGSDRASVAEPPSGGFIRKKFDSTEDRELTEILYGLMKEIHGQLERRMLDKEYEQKIKQKIFKRLLSGL